MRARSQAGEDVLADQPAAVSGAADRPDAARPVRVGRAGLLRWLRRSLVLAVVVGAGYQLVKNWPVVAHTLTTLPWTFVLLSSICVFAGVWLGPLVWQTVLADLGAPIGVRSASKIYLVGQLGKYVPGNVWAFVVQMELGASVGVSRARGFTASLVATGLCAIASLLTGTLVLPTFLSANRAVLGLFVLLPLGLVFLHPKPLTWLVSRVLRLLRRPPLPHALRGRAIAKALALGVLIYTVLGVHLWLLATAVGASGARSLVLCVGTMGLALTASMVAFFLPSGLGARELVIVTALAAVMPSAQALALAVVSRVMFTVADVVSAGGAALVAYRRGGRPSHASAAVIAGR